MRSLSRMVLMRWATGLESAMRSQARSGVLHTRHDGAILEHVATQCGLQQRIRLNVNGGRRLVED